MNSFEPKGLDLIACEEYLGLNDATGAKGCDKAFDNLITNMAARYRALAPTERVRAPYWI